MVVLYAKTLEEIPKKRLWENGDAGGSEDRLTNGAETLNRTGG